MSRRDTRRRRRNRYGSGEDVNPMDFVSNLSDVMLILAVGIMLALVLHWNVDIETQSEDTEQVEESSDVDTIQFDNDDLENKDELPEDAEQMGRVYYDPDTDTYYIIRDEE